MPRLLRHDRVHDYAHLIRRWRRLARALGVTLKKFGEAGNCDLFCLENSRAGDAALSLYLSAGIHGDEPAATEGILTWAEKNADLLGKMNFLIFPCLNPWGLIANSRLDSEGRDLNRSFHDDSVVQVKAHKLLLEGRNFHLALTMHEDYDANGVYIYEVPSRRPYWGEEMLAAASRLIPPDSRKKIEGRSSRLGVVRRAIKPDLMPDWPEAFVLHFQHARRTFTIETPSEFAIDDRVAAQVAIITRAVSLARRELRAEARRS